MISTILPHLGWISIGIGESMGAIIGTYFGKNKWKGRSRTLEGSLSMLVSMIVSLTLVIYTSSYFVNAYFVSVIVASTLTTLMEAWTSENDNLLLPLHYSALLVSLLLISS
jgi:dolichol kinase